MYGREDFPLTSKYFGCQMETDLGCFMVNKSEYCTGFVLVMGKKQ